MATVGILVANRLLSFLLVALAAPTDQQSAVAFANTAMIVGGASGFLFCLLGGWWVARNDPKNGLLNGLVLGLAVAALNILNLALSGAVLLPAHVATLVARMAGGVIGGWVGSSKAAA